MNEQLAARLLTNKGKQIINHHNSLHTYMAKMNFVAKQLNIVPKLPVNEISCEAVATAHAALSCAVQAHVVVEAFDLVIKGRTDPEWGQACQGVPAEIPREVRTTTPTPLLAELETIATTPPAMGSKVKQQPLLVRGKSSAQLVPMEAESPATPVPSASPYEVGGLRRIRHIR